MRTHPWFLVGGSVAVLATAVTIAQWTRWGVVALVAATALGWLLTFRCTHRYATLLPPVRDAGPDRDHARWYCDRCGKTWDSGLVPSTQPRLIYSGYDERMAVRSAARADALDKQRRRIATRRTSGPKRTSRPAPVSRPGPRPVEAVLEQRAVGYDDHESTRPFAAVRRT